MGNKMLALLGYTLIEGRVTTDRVQMHHPIFTGPELEMPTSLEAFVSQSMAGDETALSRPAVAIALVVATLAAAAGLEVAPQSNSSSKRPNTPPC